jgi:UDP-N-acetylmuramoyl-L-alanyl-D-glutamate--2,6-diaminopimelate ligase
MVLKELLTGYDYEILKGDVNNEVINIAYDSRKVSKGFIFVCIEGFKTDGHNYIKSALDNGASFLVVQKEIEINYIENTVIKVKDSRHCLAFLADRFFNHPSQSFNLIGITGTKGKTTTTYMIKSILEANGEETGLIGTVANMIKDRVLPADKTTPESYDLQSMFYDMKNEKVDSVIMEVSSHALDLHRVSCCDFNIGIFSNLSRDHLDFHINFDNYFRAKSKLFSLSKVGLINIDNEYGRKLTEELKTEFYTYSLNNNADITAYDIFTNRESVEFKIKSKWGDESFKVNVPGIFNVYNALAAIGAARILGIGFEAIKEGLKRVSVPGRLEVVEIDKEYSVIIDYAHTPDSLENVLKTIRDYVCGRLICVFGCGGDRDKTKRPIMGKISGELSDYTIITTDNPRTEDPEAIIRDIESGIKGIGKNYISISDRREAIKYALSIGKKDDVILLAGKGHETYQIFRDKTIHFDEREEVFKILGIDKR